MRTRWIAVAVIVFGLLVLDQATKIYAVRHLKDAPQQQYLGDTIRVTYAENPGAFLSIMSTWSPQARFVVLTVLNSIVLLLLGGYLVTRPHLDWWSIVAFACIFAGGVGNLIDRVRLDNIVIDFLNIGLGSLRTGIFNVADMAIMAGFFILLGLAFLRPTPQPAAD